MVVVKAQREVLTPEQAADVLQVNRETIYRYIKDGRLVASKLGRSYRIPRRSLELLLWATRTRDDIPLRAYSAEEVTDFLRRDELDEAATEIVNRINIALAMSSER